MKTITKNIKAKYFAKYLGIKCIEYKNELYYLDGVRDIFYNDEDDIIQNIHLTDSHIIERNLKFVPISLTNLLLTPLEQISDEDAEIIARLDYRLGLEFLRMSKEKLIGYGRVNVQLSISQTKIYQYLQSKGYALPYMDYSVSDLVENGTIRLKTK